MDTQAANLRARVAAAAASVAPATQQQPAVKGASVQTPVRLARTIAVASGKGGVGKSTLALGIAMAAAERGVKTALVDADLGLANLDVLCGVRPARTAADWLSGRAQLSECFTTIAPRLWLLAGASGVARMADLEPPQRARLIEGLARVAAHVELMVVDLGAGIGAGTLDIAAAADRLLIVTTPEPTSLADAYGFAKACVRHGRRDGWCCATTMAIDPNRINRLNKIDEFVNNRLTTPTKDITISYRDFFVDFNNAQLAYDKLCAELNLQPDYVKLNLLVKRNKKNYCDALNFIKQYDTIKKTL